MPSLRPTPDLGALQHAGKVRKKSIHTHRSMDFDLSQGDIRKKNEKIISTCSTVLYYSYNSTTVVHYCSTVSSIILLIVPPLSFLDRLMPCSDHPGLRSPVRVVCGAVCDLLGPLVLGFIQVLFGITTVQYPHYSVLFHPWPIFFYRLRIYGPTLYHYVLYKCTMRVSQRVYHLRLLFSRSRSSYENRQATQL